MTTQQYQSFQRLISIVLQMDIEQEVDDSIAVGRAAECARANIGQLQQKQSI